MTPNNGMKKLASKDARVEEPAIEQELAAVNSSPHDPDVSGDELVTTAKRFLQLPYLWSGTSGFGFDCSGFMYTVYRFHGISIPRDAKDQAQIGLKVERNQLQPGDLLFFAHQKGKGNVHHVAMYAGNGLIIHSPKTERSVEIIPLQTPEYSEEFTVARRYIPAETK
jgi:cell wall-associated NlpC family hydrolase